MLNARSKKCEVQISVRDLIVDFCRTTESWNSVGSYGQRGDDRWLLYGGRENDAVGKPVRRWCFNNGKVRYRVGEHRGRVYRPQRTNPAKLSIRGTTTPSKCIHETEKSLFLFPTRNCTHFSKVPYRRLMIEK